MATGRELTSPSPASGEQFGFAVDIEGSTALISTRRSNANGAVYTFQRNLFGQWIPTGSLPAVGVDPFEVFGGDLSLSGNVAIIGANRERLNNSETGAAYFFERDNLGVWRQTTKVFGTTNSLFGDDVAVSGNTAVISVLARDRAHVYERNVNGNWIETARLTGSDSQFLDEFGSDVAIDASTIVVGSHHANARSGAAYVFQKNISNRWDQVAKLTAPNEPANLELGETVGVSGNTIIVGTPNDQKFSGSAFVYRDDRAGNWMLLSTLRASDSTSGDLFSQVAIDGNTAIVGTWWADHSGEDNPGAAYISRIFPNRRLLN